jgi:hypothetical protein
MRRSIDRKPSAGVQRFTVCVSGRDCCKKLRKTRSLAHPVASDSERVSESHDDFPSREAVLAQRDNEKRKGGWSSEI